MRKWMIAAGVVVAVAAAAVTLWAVTRSDAPPRADTAAEAVETTCHASGASELSPRTDPKTFGHHFNIVALQRDLIPVYWGGPAPRQPLWEASVRATPSGEFEVVNCKEAQVAP